MTTHSNDATTDFNYDALLREHLQNVFNERDASRRLTALAALYHEDAVMTDPDGRYVGREAISKRVEALQNLFPDTFAFHPSSRGLGLDGIGYLPWHLDSQEGSMAVSGVDIARISAGRIQSVHVLIAPNHA